MTEDAPPLTDADAPPPKPAELPSSARERLNGVLGRLYRLQHDIDAYDAIHNAEIARLKVRRMQVVGPVERRIGRLKRFAEQFAVRAFFDYGDIGHRVPNGDITSRPVQITIDKDDIIVADQDWACNNLGDAIEMRPWVDMKKLRKWLDARVKDGHLQRLVSKPSDDPTDVEFYLVDEKEGWPWEFDPGFEGFWFWTEAGEAEYGFDHGEILEGVRWAPNGTMGSGRNFQIKL